jgi:hypothetical protein
MQRACRRIPLVSGPAFGASFGMGALPPPAAPPEFFARMKTAQPPTARPAT